MADTLLIDIGIVIIAATLISIFVRIFKQPLLLGYILSGIIIGPQILRFVKNPESIQILSDLGIAFLLFIIGMELDLKKLGEVGLVSSFLGIFQVLLTALAGFVVSLLLGFSLIESLYLGLVVSFSSTMVVIKLLVDKKELDSLHGELILGIMLIQDVIAVLVLSLIPLLGNFSIASIGGLLLKGILLLLVTFIIYESVLSNFLKAIVKSPELLFIGSLSIIFIYSGLASFLGYSMAIGAFIAGISLSTTEFHYEVQNRIKPFRDFFLVLFFVTLGMQIVFGSILKMASALVILFIIVLVIKPLITFILAKFMQYSNRTSFFTGVEIGQVGEFSLVLAAVGISNQHISSDLFSLITILALITIIITVYIINNDYSIYTFFSRMLSPLESKISKEEELKNIPEKTLNKHIIVFGFHNISTPFVKTLIKLKKAFIVVDFNPEKIRHMIKNKIPCICSDMSNPELSTDLNFAGARIVVSTIKNFPSNLQLIKNYKAINKKGIIIVVASSNSDAIELYNAGADYVILPESLGGEKISNYMIYLRPAGIRSWGKKHKKSLVEEVKF